MNGAGAETPHGKAFWLYRHAESVANAGGRTFEVSAIALTGKGEAQAAELALTIDAARGANRVADPAAI
jgi:broad specificity phosphatase PhoE